MRAMLPSCFKNKNCYCFYMGDVEPSRNKSALNKAMRFIFIAITEAIIGITIVAVIGMYAVLILVREDLAGATEAIVTVTGILGLLSGICFAYAACLAGANREIIVECGEDLLYACLFFVMGLVIKFGINTIMLNDYYNVHSLGGISYRLYGSLFAKFFFILPVVFSIGGFKSLLLFLYRRRKQKHSIHFNV